MPKTYRQIAINNYNRMIAGDRITIDELAYNDVINFCDDFEKILDLCSCVNSKSTSVANEFVAWIGDKNKPTDLVLNANGSQYAAGSV